MTARPTTPYIPGSKLLPYQRRWVDDEARWKFGIMSRQVGKDFSSAFEGVREILRSEMKREKCDWLIVAPSERQSLESLEKWKDWTREFKGAIKAYEEVREGQRESLLKSATIVFPRGSRVIAVPGRPDTVRGYSANVLLTEFAFFENPDATWRAILPSITNPMRGGEKKVRLITTPNGIGNKAHEIWSKNFMASGGTGVSPVALGVPPGASSSDASSPGQRPAETGGTSGPPSTSRWSCHLVDIYTAVQEGLPINVEELRAAIDDADGWAQEFECQFIDAQTVLLPYELIAACESPEATTVVAPEFWQTKPAHPIDIGIDFGRRHDLTVCWSNARLGDVAHTVEVLELANMATPEQVELLRPRIARARRVCLDYTGPGVGLGDYLAREFGEWKPAANKHGKIELCTFSQTLKVELFSKLRMAFEKRTVRVPVNRAVREDLHSVNRVASDNGGITYRAPRGVGGHADRCTALALALRAVQGGASTANFFIIDSRINRVLAARRDRVLHL